MLARRNNPQAFFCGDEVRSRFLGPLGEACERTLLAAGLPWLEVSEDELLAGKSTDPEKQALAWLLKKHTKVTGVWLAGRLRMGHRVNASRASGRVTRAENWETKRLKSRMLQCTG